MNLIQTIKPDIVNITRFSARPKTKAKNMQGRIPTKIVKERSTKLSKICNELSKQKNIKHVGKTYNVLTIEKRDNNSYMGRTKNYKAVILNEDVEIGEFLQVKITDAKSTHLVGKLI